ncbi:hypothetical protein ACFO25_15120 [Paenactinomyces guangxiensis]|uniref:Uncharacterized protein n=1 Tax=Paenactinomyces guangxiensis TaxID=1490290 RepID=A0A7W1WPR3_9BACL|nr:hypothetical protein [Paenactinomyces guangxiensis]MBA4493809.1 hypothetical protein [Paenactinomyces guangxiensis]MBH8591275.1 hypothetical protein [Paenactinomyces guangxiensis]
MLREEKLDTSQDIRFVIMEMLFALVLTILFVFIKNNYSVHCEGEAKAAIAFFGLVLFIGPLLLLFFIFIMVMLRRLANKKLNMRGIKVFVLVIVSQVFAFVLIGGNTFYQAKSCTQTGSYGQEDTGFLTRKEPR